MSITSKGLLQRQRDAAGTDWRNYAACRDVDPDLFFSLGTVGTSVAQIEQATTEDERAERLAGSMVAVSRNPASSISRGSKWPLARMTAGPRARNR
jgi:hypothetical protein